MGTDTGAFEQGVKNPSRLIKTYVSTVEMLALSPHTSLGDHQPIQTETAFQEELRTEAQESVRFCRSKTSQHPDSPAHHNDPISQRALPNAHKSSADFFRASNPKQEPRLQMRKWLQRRKLLLFFKKSWTSLVACCLLKN